MQVSGSAQARADDSASLRLTGFGYAQLTPVGAAPERVAEGGQLSYRWSQQLTEWWVNQPGRLEQWFRLASRPEGGDGSQPLRLVMALQTGLTPVLAGQQLQLKDAQGATRLHYDRLKVWDASGAELPARMLLAGHTLTLAVDDAHAQYPLTIDPSWGQQAYVKASNTDADDRFGWAVALSGDTLAMGAPLEASSATGIDGNQADNSASAAGAVYVFTRSGGTWSQQAYIKASNTGSGDGFGWAVALSGDGDTLAVGASWEDSSATGIDGDQADESAGNAGAVYVFTRSSSTWSQQAYIKASNTGKDDRFGHAVALSDDTLAVGAYREASSATGIDSDQTDDSADHAGAVYVFTRNGSTWSQQAYIKASNTGRDDEFGYAVALWGDTLAVGALGEASNATGIDGNQENNRATNAGAVYLFQLSHTVTPSVNPAGGGTISPDTPQTVLDGRTLSFTLTPDAGQAIASVDGTCGGSLVGTTYTTAAITADCTVEVSFAAIVAGSCGSADGVPVTTAPTTNLCSAGGAGSVTGDGPWNWTCSGAHGGGNASCQAPAFSPVTRFEGPSPTGTGTVTVDLAGGGPFCGFTGTPAMVAAVPGASPARPAGIVFPHGLFDFRASHCEPGSTITLTMKLPAALPETAKHYKWGPAPGSTTAHWQPMPASIAGDTVTFSITDGGQGDDDLAVDGSIADPSGPGIPGDGGMGGEVTPVPTLGQWSLMLLGLLAAGLGARRLRRG